ncbi:MAG: hypothetical protein QM687_00615 [Ferruginibacter sp.]
MGFIDFLLFPLYVLLFYLLFARFRKKIADPRLKVYHKYGFWAKILGSFCITIFYGYITVGDSTSLYYTEGRHLYSLILKDASNIQWLFKTGIEYPQQLIYVAGSKGYFASEANFFIIKMVAVFCFFSFGRYMIINLFFSMLAFSGLWKLFQFFYNTYPSLHKKIALAVLFLPTVVFWSSGALKDPVCMAMLGWFTYATYSVFYKKKSVLLYGIASVVSGLILFTVKPYILFAYLPFFALYLVFINLSLVSNYFIKLAVFLLIGGISIVGFVAFTDKLNEEMGTLAVEKLSESVAQQQNNFANMSDRAQSSFSLGVEYDGQSIGSLLKIAPAAINATLFRPYLWESKKISTLLSSLESLALMIYFLFVLLKVGPLKFIGSIIKDPLIMYCFFFSILFALFIGATTLNFGTLVRYKIPCMPFFLLSLMFIFDKGYSKNKAVLKEKLS